MTHNSKILQNILTETLERKSRGESLVAIFDLDSTLYNLEPRILKILQDFGSQNETRKLYPAASDKLVNLGEVPKRYHVTQFMAALGLANESKEFFAAMDRHWKQKFFDGGSVLEDIPYDGAVEYVQTLHQNGATIWYLTGRDEPKMGHGTRASLRHWGFPFEVERTELFLKPHDSMDDAGFKRDFFLERAKPPLSPWLFENEPVNIRLINESSPHVRVVYFDSAHMGVEEPPAAPIPWIRHFLVE